MIEIWQCDEEGKFSKLEGFQRIIPNLTNGNFSFKTVKPGFISNYNGCFQCPHILNALH